MESNIFPTKGNLLIAKKVLRTSVLGYELMDKKRNVLIREIMELNEKVKNIQSQIVNEFAEAYKALQTANIETGMANIDKISRGAPIEDSVEIKTRSVMGVEIPIVEYEVKNEHNSPFYGFSGTPSALDEAVYKFNCVKKLVIQLAAIESAAYRLAVNIKKTQKRANALKNITLPKYEELVKNIQETIEERERDEFTRLKVWKKG